jgi:uncharacterized protein (TIGR00255 family)
VSQHPVRSMTGYARVRRHIVAGELILSVKGVNHRALDVHCHLPPEFEPYENALRTAVKQHALRGHIEVRVSLQRVSGAARQVLNRDLLVSFLDSFRWAAREYNIPGEPDLNAALRINGMLADADAEPEEEIERDLVACLAEALALFNAFRQREGAELVATIRAANDRVLAAAARMEEIRGGAMPAFQARLTERLTALLANVGLEPQRITQEAAMLADRSDIHEELSRLGIHARQLDQMLTAGGEVGKKIDFLLQEMNRETNTILSKTNGLGDIGLTITGLALGVKSDVEKIREQGLNLE